MSSDARRFNGNVKLATDERVLGFLFVELEAADDNRGSTWGGRVRGSDYLVWGANGKRLRIEFADGEHAHAVFRSGGTIRGLGPRPHNLGDPSA